MFFPYDSWRVQRVNKWLLHRADRLFPYWSLYDYIGRLRFRRGNTRDWKKHLCGRGPRQLLVR